jgi:hypothetical protein
MTTRAIIPGPTPANASQAVGTLPVAHGGTGATDAAGARTALAAASTAHAGTHATGGTDVFNPDVSQIIGLGSALALKQDAAGLAAVALSGAYADLSGAPTIPQPANVAPSPLGAAVTGSNNTYARADHSHLQPSLATLGAAGSVHTHAESDITGLTADLAAKANASALAAKADVSSVPVASSATPAAVGTAAVGVGADFARGDHVHALPDVGVAGTYGDATHYPIPTVDAKGRVTGFTTQAVAGAILGPLEVNGTFYTATGSIAATDVLAAIDATAGNVVMTLPAGPTSGAFSRLLYIVRADGSANTVTIQRLGAGGINGATTYTGLTAAFKTVTLMWAGSDQWVIVAST